MGPEALIFFVVAMAGATILTRFMAFWLPQSLTSHPLMTKLRTYLPLTIMLLLVIYALKDIPWTVCPWGFRELGSLLLVVALQWWGRNALLSIGAGTALYMVWIRLVP